MSELVPFGKHKGKPVEVMLADEGYKEWLLSQPWVRERYPTFHQTIINYRVGEAVETPEHNQMQAAFLNESRCLALARIVCSKAFFDGTLTRYHIARKVPQTLMTHLTPHDVAARVYGRKFEDGGWDVTYNVEGPGTWLEEVSIPSCICRCDHDKDCAPAAKCHGGEDWCRHDRHERKRIPTLQEFHDGVMVPAEHWQHCNKECPWHDPHVSSWLNDCGDEHEYHPIKAAAISVELKPDLGDDFPAILRQVNSHKEMDARVVVARRAAFEHVTWEQVVKMFAESQIWLITERQIEEIEG